MLRSVTLILLAAGSLAHAAIWPEEFAGLKRTSVRPVAVQQKAIWEEYGFEEAEEAGYTASNGKFTATAWRLGDSTGAMAAFQWQRPAGARPSDLGKLAVETPGSVLLAFGNYLFRFDGRRPEVRELAHLFDALPRLEQSSLPALSDYLPSQNLTPNSERYVIGPATLEAFESRIPPSVAAFRYGTEAQLGKFKTGAGEMALAIFSYPTPHIARERIVEFEKLPGALAKRSGPIIAVIVSPGDANEAERLLSQIRYKASLTWNDYTADRRENVANLILTALTLTGIVLLFCLASSLAFAGLRLFMRKVFGHSDAGDPMIALHLSDR
jgi:uncharacterized protein DUF6599